MAETRNIPWLRWIVGLVAVVLLIILAAVVFVLTPTGRDYVARFALKQIPLNDGYAFHLDQSEGRIPDRLLLLGVSLHAPDGTPVLAIDSARIGIHLRPLLSRRVQLTDVWARGVNIAMTQDSAGSWDLVDAFPVDTTSSGLSIRIGSLTLSDAHLQARYYTETGADSIATAGPINLLAHDIEMVDRYGAQIDSLVAPFVPAGLDTPATVSLAGSFYNDTVQIRTARLSSVRSNLTATGALTPESANLQVTASPLDFADLTPFVSAVNPDVIAEGNVSITGDSGDWSAHGAFDFGPYGLASIDAQARDVEDLERLVAEDFANANATVRLTNVSPTIAAQLTEATNRLGGISGTVRLVESVVSVDLNAPVAVTGEIRPFDESPSYNVVAILRQFDVGRLGLDGLPPDLNSSVTGSVRIAGTGFSTPELVITPELRDSRVADVEFESLVGAITMANEQLAANVRVDTLRTTDLVVTDVGVTVRLENDVVRFSQTAALINGGSVASTGSYTLPGQSGVHRVALEEARFDSLRLQGGVLSGTATGNVAFAGVTSMDGMLALNLLPSRFNEAVIEAGDGELEFDGADVHFRFDLRTSSGRMAALGTATPFADAPTYDIRNVELTNVNAGSLLGIDNLSTDLNATVTGRFAPEDSQPLEYEIHLSQSRINGQSEIGGTIRADSTRDKSVLIDLTWPTASDSTGGIRGSLAFVPGEPSAFSATADIRHADFGKFARHALDERLGATVDTVDSDVSFRLRLDGTGSGLLDAVATLTVDSLNGSIGTNRIRSGTLVARADSGLIDFERVQLETNAGTIDGQGPLVLDDSGRESAFYLVVNAEDLALISDLIPGAARLGGIGSVTASVVGPPAATHLSLDGTFGALAWDQTRSATVEVYLETTMDESRQFSALDGRFRVVNLIVGTASFRDTRIQASLVDSLIQFKVESDIDNRRNASATGSIDPRPEAQLATINAANIRLDNDRWTLLQPSTFTWDEAFRIRNLLLFTDDQQIAVDGIIDLDGDQSLILTVENFRIGSVADMLGYAGLDGAMNGYLDLVGPAEAPVIQGDLNVDLESNRRGVGDLQIAVRYDSLQLVTTGILRHQDGGSLQFDGLVPLDLRLAGDGDQTLRVRASDSAPDSDVDLAIEANSFPMDWLLPFLDRSVYSRLAGVVDGDLAVEGTFAEPRMTGTAAIQNGAIGLPMFGIEVTEMNGGLVFEGQTIRITSVRGESGRGHAVATGAIELENLALGAFDISLDLDNFLAIDNSDYRASTGGDLLLYGSTRAPVVSGNLRLASLDLYYKGAIEEFEPVTLTERDLREVEIVFGKRITAADTTTYDFFRALTIDVSLEMTRDSWLRSDQNPRMDVPFYGSLDVSKEPNEDLQLFGTIDIVEERGRIVQLGRRFDVKRGTITYNGPLSEPRVDLEATYTVQTRGVGGQTEENIQISLLAQGSLDDLDVTLTSDPQMETTDILSYILLGRPARESLQFGGGDESFAADVALSQAAGFLEGIAGQELGLDVVRIEYEGTEVKLTAGKYLSPGIYVAVSQPIVLNSASTRSAGSSPSERGLLVEIELVRGLLARLQQQGPVFGINLFWVHAW